MKTKINQLLSYAIDNQIIIERDLVYSLNNVCFFLSQKVDFTYQYTKYNFHIDELLTDLITECLEVEASEIELYKTKLMGILMDKPSTIEANFKKKYANDPQKAMNYLYNYAKKVNYIKEQQIAKNIVYQVDSRYGLIDITINLSKPEKTPAQIAAQKNGQQSNYPACLLCKEHEGLFGSVSLPDRANHRLITFKLGDEKWYFQYSPYSYFEQHSILLADQHEPMEISAKTYQQLIDFVDQVPHYVIGSNADLPIVGGSMLSHNHYQTGCYQFPIFNAEKTLIKKENNVNYFQLNWPLHTVLITSDSRNELLKAANKVHTKWNNYSNHQINVIAQTNVQHNTITPIVQKVDRKYEMYLILRNNRTNQDNPSGIFHVKEERFNIKQENIGLIEAMGLAVLPARLERELKLLVNLTGNLPNELIKHQNIYNLLQGYTEEERLASGFKIIGEVFVKCLEDCGVFKYNNSEYTKFINEI